jgi:NADP-dependent 3-hydroxy acid dehydrogenase YdfG
MDEPQLNRTILTAGQVAVISGASAGIGREAALALAARGLRLALLARRPEPLAEVAALALDAGAPDVVVCPCDVREESSVREAVAATLQRFGRIDILLNNAGLSLNGEIDGYSMADWRTVLDTNLTGTFLLCREVLPTMKAQRSGQILNVSSGAGRNGIRGMAAYCASKFGVVGLTEALGHEVRAFQIRVAVLLPGSVATDFSRVANRRPLGEAAQEPEEIGYAMLPEEVASVIVAMLSQPEQAWMSEVVLRPLNLELRRSRS